MLFVTTLISVEIGFLWTTIIAYILMTVAYYEMIKVQTRQTKEENLSIKTKWVEWYFYGCIQFYMVSRTWLTKEILSNTEIYLPKILDEMLFKYHSFYTFCLLASGMIFFVLSLEEGFYAYQFKQMGWSILNLMVIVGSGHGLLIALWKMRMWFVYTLLCMCFRDTIDHLVSNYVKVGPPMHTLSPKSSLLGYIIGGASAFVFYFAAVDEMLN